MRPDIHRAAELGAVLARTFPDAPAEKIGKAVVAMQQAAVRHKAHQITRCNVPLSPEQEQALSLMEDRAEQAALTALAALGGPEGKAGLRFGGDPMGPCGVLHIEGAPGDGWGGAGIYPLY
jgi:hypothetical protein